jgi:hypothetical protein
LRPGALVGGGGGGGDDQDHQRRGHNQDDRRHQEQAAGADHLHQHAGGERADEGADQRRRADRPGDEHREKDRELGDGRARLADRRADADRDPRGGADADELGGGQRGCPADTKCQHGHRSCIAHTKSDTVLRCLFWGRAG